MHSKDDVMDLVVSTTRSTPNYGVTIVWCSLRKDQSSEGWIDANDPWCNIVTTDSSHTAAHAASTGCLHVFQQREHTDRVWRKSAGRKKLTRTVAVHVGIKGRAKAETTIVFIGAL